MRTRLVIVAALIVASAPLARAQGAKIKFVKVYLSGDRIVEGEITAEDEQSITLKTELAEAPLPKADVVYMIRSELTPDELKAKRRARNVYTSLLLGYKVQKPDDWTFKFDPPRPLSDVILRSKDQELEIGVYGQPDDTPDQPLDDAMLKGLSAGMEQRLREKFLDVKKVKSEKTSWKDKPALYLEFSMKRKDSKKEFRSGQLIFRIKTNLVYPVLEAPSARFDKAKETYDDVMKTLELTEANAQEGDRLFSRDALFVLEKPQDWTFAKGNEAQAVKDEAWVRVEPRPLDAKGSLEGWAKDEEPALASSLAGSKKLASGGVNVCGRLGQQLVFEYADKKRKRITYLLKDEQRGYKLSADFPTDKEQYAPIVGEVLGRFRILNSLLAQGALERSLKAIDHLDEADKKSDRNDHAGAIALYEQAIQEFPRYATAYNNMGVSALHGKDQEKAARCFQRAYELFSEDPQIRGNFALSLVIQGLDALNQKKGDEAQRLIDRARNLAPPNDDSRDLLVEGYEGLAFYYADKENWGTAASWQEKALGLKPKDPALMKNMGAICGSAAVSSWNKRNTSGARTWADKALRYDPNNGNAKQVLDLCKKNK